MIPALSPKSAEIVPNVSPPVLMSRLAKKSKGRRRGRAEAVYSEANAWKKVGNVPRMPSAVRTAAVMRIGRRSRFWRRHRA
jgi:hypothetical protein